MITGPRHPGVMHILLCYILSLSQQEDSVEAVERQISVGRNSARIGNSLNLCRDLI